MIRIALWSRSVVSDDFTDQMVEQIRSQATTGYITRDEHNKLLIQFGEQAARLDRFEKLLSKDKPAHLKVVHVS